MGGLIQLGVPRQKQDNTRTRGANYRRFGERVLSIDIWDLKKHSRKVVCFFLFKLIYPFEFFCTTRSWVFLVFPEILKKKHGKFIPLGVFSRRSQQNKSPSHRDGIGSRIHKLHKSQRKVSSLWWVGDTIYILVEWRHSTLLVSRQESGPSTRIVERLATHRKRFTCMLRLM